MIQGRDNRNRGETATAAAGWVVRLRAPDAGESDWLAFEAWAGAHEGAREAFDTAEAIWTEVGMRAEDISDRLGQHSRARPARRDWRRAPAALFGVVLALLAVASTPYLVGWMASAPVAYATAKGERRTIRLADGSRIDLNSASGLTVRIDGRRREVAMSDSAEAAFDVTHDPSRPFIIHVGDQTVRVVGTQFDISHRSGLISVTVRRGVVRVTPRVASAALSLTPGQRLVRREGDAAARVEQVTADDAFAWRDGRLICRDEPLAEVVGDLNRYFPAPISIDDDQLAALRFSGVLTLDDESSTVRRLAALLPLSATSADGVIVLKSRNPVR